MSPQETRLIDDAVAGAIVLATALHALYWYRTGKRDGCAGCDGSTAPDPSAHA